MTILIAAKEAMTKAQINFCLEIEENLIRASRKNL